MKKIYLIQANNVYGDSKKSTYIPYAAGCIQAYCEQNPVIKSEYEFGKIIYARESPEKVISKLKDPYMVLFSCSVWNMEYNKVVAEKLKEIYPQCLITFGGHSVSADGEMLEKYSYVDFLTHRFGEEPTEGLLVAIAKDEPLDNVSNISYRNSEGKIVTTKYEAQTNTDYPSPYLEGVFDELLKDDIDFSVLFETNRGCPNSCSFCDWGSLKSKVRLFPMERVIAEIDWFVEHKIEFVFCTDGNFCLFNRDAEIADYIVKCKQKFGYPQCFRVCFTKNRFDFVYEIGTKFFKNGLDKAQTLSFQSMNEEVLRNVGRKNISVEKFRELMQRYNEINISTFSELILGLPGETYESFSNGVSTLIENGQHFAINIYPCELLPNSEMGQRDYIEKYSIKSTRVPFKLIHSANVKNESEITEYSEYVTSTYSMKTSEWIEALIFSYYIQGLHNLGLLRAIAVYCCNEYDMKYDEFYTGFLRYSSKQPHSLLNDVYCKIKELCYGIVDGKNELVTVCEDAGDILWGFDELIYLEFYKKLEEFYAETKKYIVSCFEESEIIDALFDYQYSIVKKIGISEIEIMSEYDFYSYFNTVFSNNYAKLQKRKIVLKINDSAMVSSFQDFAREVIWYGRNRRASDYTSNNYKVSFSAE